MNMLSLYKNHPPLGKWNGI